MATKEEHQKALKAFKKRLRMVQRDHETSSLCRPVSSGRKSSIIAIVPPAGFPPEIWQELCDKGRLRRIPGEPTFEVVSQDES